MATISVLDTRAPRPRGAGPPRPGADGRGLRPRPEPVPCTDVHQHLWPEDFLAALGRRTAPPRLRRRGSAWVLQAHGEPDWPVDPRDHEPFLRAALARADGLDRVLVAPSAPIGVEALPADEAAPLVEAYNSGAIALPAPFTAWATAAVQEPDPGALGVALDGGAAGLCLPAGALSGPVGLERVAPLLGVLANRRAALFVHPGPAPWTPLGAARPDDPAWWPAMHTYVVQMNAAWHVHLAHLRPAFPDLAVCFAMLAGLGPLHHGRLSLRGGPATRPDPLTFLETSSYGPAEVRAVGRVVGPAQLVYGSDRPVVAPQPAPVGGAPLHRHAAAARLLGADRGDGR